MKKHPLIRHSLACFVITVLAAPGALAQTTTWDGVGAWNQADSWSNGLPDGSTDAIVTKTSGAASSLVIPTGTAFRDLHATNSNSSAGSLRIALSNGTAGGSVFITATDAGAITFVTPKEGSATFTGSLSLVSSNNSTYSASLLLEADSTLTVAGGISFGANADPGNTPTLLPSNMAHGTLGGGITINADLTFNNGSRYWVTSDGGLNGLFSINGSVTLQAGGFTGNAASFEVGRATNVTKGETVRIRDGLSVSDSATVLIRKGKILEADSATFQSGGRLTMNGWTGAEGTAVLRTTNDLTVRGGQIVNTTATGSNGTYLLDVGGNFILGTGSGVQLSSNVTLGITTLQLRGNFDVEATALAAGNLNELRVVLDGTEAQSLEAAVLDSNQTFRVHSLTFAEETSVINLVDEHLNLGSGEFFRTANLFNEGNTILNLNGLEFYVGDTLLSAGTYTTYGGELTVIPEPSTFALLGATFAGAFAFRRRK